MAKIPDFLLRALYVKGRLRNTDDGFEFQMKNELGPVRIIGARPLMVDRRPIPLDQCDFIHGEHRARFADVTPDKSVLMRKGEAVSIHVSGMTLATGRRTLGIDVIAKDLGQVRFNVSDKLS
ncbi:MAG: hypothetical protein WA996_07125 [Candidatus Promineifilaceae bacterium]